MRDRRAHDQQHHLASRPLMGCLLTMCALVAACSAQQPSITPTALKGFGDASSEVSQSFIEARHGVVPRCKDLPPKPPTPSIPSTSNQANKPNRDKGLIGADDISNALKLNAKRFQQCYVYELKRKNMDSGKMVIKFVLGVDGLVKSVRTTCSDLNSRMNACMEGVFKDIVVPGTLSSEVTVNKIFVFSAAK